MQDESVLKKISESEANIIWPTQGRVLCVLLISLSLLAHSSFAEERWSVEGQGILVYTDDVGMFSATRRLSRDSDPTQPAIDSNVSDKGSDMVFEPELTLTRSMANRLGHIDLEGQAQGFIFTDNSRFNHGTLHLQATQAVDAISPATWLQARFYYAPNQFLGDNEERQSGQSKLVAEKLSSYIWSTRLMHDVTEDLSVRLLGRYGLRRYQASFSERNTNFWTIGPHVEWNLDPEIKIELSYHYERGLAKGRNQPQFEDDVSYINHYWSVDGDIELTERLSLQTAFHYEHNIWTSSLAGDERNGAHENVYQGDITLAYWLTDSIQGFGEIQYSSRKESFESSFDNTNISIGLTTRF